MGISESFCTGKSDELSREQITKLNEIEAILLGQDKKITIIKNILCKEEKEEEKSDTKIDISSDENEKELSDSSFYHFTCLMEPHETSFTLKNEENEGENESLLQVKKND